MDKRDRAEIFRQRVLDGMQRTGLNRSQLARATRSDRTTIGQLLTGDSPRLPNANLAADIASELGVSCDWLLGLTDRPERPGDLLAAAMDITDAKRTTADAQILAWHAEAAGYKIRHVPATLPDMLKTEAMLVWEYETHLGKSPDQAIQTMQDTQKLLMSGQSDFEIAVPVHEVTALAEGSGYYRGVPAKARQEQLTTIADICERSFPGLRLFLFDARTVYSAPVTIFGPLLATIYVGNIYLAFRSSERIKALTAHFDWLVREATVDARDLPDYLRQVAKGGVSSLQTDATQAI